MAKTKPFSVWVAEAKKRIKIVKDSIMQCDCVDIKELMISLIFLKQEYTNKFIDEFAEYLIEELKHSTTIEKEKVLSFLKGLSNRL